MKNKRIDDADQVSADLPFEAALTELDAVLERMESGRLTLEESLTTYRRGAALLRHCQSQLDDADARLRILEGESLKPLDIADGSSA
ncbi:MAG TPA: exodeoxyribonuclease VII small subunit [Rhodocyclaceae bacterium]